MPYEPSSETCSSHYDSDDIQAANIFMLMRHADQSSAGNYAKHSSGEMGKALPPVPPSQLVRVTEKGSQAAGQPPTSGVSDCGCRWHQHCIVLPTRSLPRHRSSEAFSTRAQLRFFDISEYTSIRMDACSVMKSLRSSFRQALPFWLSSDW
ncbi:hypothetical protein M409DRAFT_29492 [Zasmidium cellare ATCC 36951]|uniref:Uncharacterized protein n=1 Tax=Zasmidium cellare ATCC 36951 TaxID=1080233 RepID=A0A6A6C1K7_ZASCE|nr:uncharacterized protein M409DRAFT_29492 [Zasmidium cellare ATCC 36951]KAF2160040.1 hypothetical protein M409DRAFT_29492 [Zasmidium cellare ATCC 36951]